MPILRQIFRLVQKQILKGSIDSIKEGFPEVHNQIVKIQEAYWCIFKNVRKKYDSNGRFPQKSPEDAMDYPIQRFIREFKKQSNTNQI